MSNLPQQNSEQRRISNLPPNQTANYTIENNQSPVPLSREQILYSPNPNQAPQSIINNQYTNNPNQFQQVPIVNPALVANQMYPQNTNVIVIRQIERPGKIYNNRYTPTTLTCPYCMKKVTSVPSTYWSGKSCNTCSWIFCLYFFSAGLCLILDLSCLACNDGDYCCYEADHKCPHCNNIIAIRNLNNRMCN